MRGIAFDGVPEAAPAQSVGQATTFEVRCYNGSRLVFSAAVEGEIRDDGIHAIRDAVTFEVSERTVVTSTCYWWSGKEGPRNQAYAVIEPGGTLTLQMRNPAIALTYV
jgi:hypothetical protein